MDVMRLISLITLSATSFAFECDKSATVCETSLEITHTVTMMHPTVRAVYPSGGKLYKYDVTNTSSATPIDPRRS